MIRSELVGYVRKSNAGNALKVKVLKSAVDRSVTEKGPDGETDYIILLMNLSKIRMILGDEQEVTSVCQLVGDEDEEESG